MIAELFDVVADIDGDDVAIDGPQLADKRYPSQTHLDLNDVRSVAGDVELTAAWFEEAGPGVARLLPVPGPFRDVGCVVSSLVLSVLGHRG